MMGRPDGTITLVLVDDHEMVRRGVRSFLEKHHQYSIVDEAGGGAEAIEVAAKWKPHVLVADIAMPQLNGFEVIRQVRRRSPETKIVMFTMYADEPRVSEAMRLGAMGYVLKQADPTCLIHAIEAVLRDRQYLSPPLTERAVEEYLARLSSDPAQASSDPLKRLTQREMDIFRLAAQGLTYAEVGARLGIGYATVHTHLVHVMRKLGVRNSRGLVRYALERGLIDKDQPEPSVGDKSDRGPRNGR